jgi:hypothetical protein
MIRFFIQNLRIVLRKYCGVTKLLVAFFFIACSNNQTVFIEGPSKLLKNPYPYNYPSTNPQPNEIVTILNKGDEGEVLSYTYGKDYKAYKVKMKDGKSGYLISGDNFRLETKLR